MFQQWASSNTLGLHEQASWMHTHLVSFFSFHTLIALVHLLHGNPYSSHWHQLMGISIARWLAASMWNFLPFGLLHNHHFILPVVLCPWLTLMYLREDWKSLRTSKVWNNCLACHRGCAWFEYVVWWRWSIARLYDFVGITFFNHVILRRHNCLVNMLEVLCQVAFHIKNSVFIIYLLEDEQELSLGMLDTSPTYL